MFIKTLKQHLLYQLTQIIGQWSPNLIQQHQNGKQEKVERGSARKREDDEKRIKEQNRAPRGNTAGGTNNAQWKTFSNTVTQLCTETLDTKSIEGTKRKQTQWWREELKEAVRKKTHAFIRWMETRQPNDRATYKEARIALEDIKKEVSERSLGKNRKRPGRWCEWK